MLRHVGLVALLGVLTACPRGRPSGPRADAADAPYQLDDDDDRAEETQRLAAMPPNARERAALRAAIARATAARLENELERARFRPARRLVAELLALWRDDPGRFAPEAAVYVPTLRRARDAFSRAGDDSGALAALVALAEADTANRKAWTAELDEVLAFTDELAKAEAGDVAVRSRAIPALGPIVRALPVPWLVDRYVELVAARQLAVNDALGAGGASIELVKAHHDVLEATHQIAGAFARAGRIEDLVDRVGRLNGLGADRGIGVAAAKLAGRPLDGAPWRVLAGLLATGRRPESRDDDDPGAGYALCATGLGARPREAALLACAGETAASDERPQLAIAMYERLFADGAEDEESADRLAGLYRDRIGQLGFAGRLHAARAAGRRLDDFVKSMHGRVPVRSLLAWRRDGSVVLARALVSQGHLDEARRILVRIAEAAPTIEALEALAGIEADRGKHGDARKRLEQAIELGGDGVADELVRGRLHRLAGEAARLEGDDGAAARHYVAALSIWAGLSGDEDRRIELPPAVNGLRLVESGRALWAIGEPDKAVDVLEAALAVDADGEDTHVQVVAFLILNHRLGDATAAFHRALASDQIGDEGKVYMALWLLGEAKRAGARPDRAALELLASRRGSAWWDDLARAATGKLNVKALARAARSPIERAELAFYTATLSLGAPPPDRVRALLEEVVRSDLILVFERESARNRLRERTR